MKFKMPPSKTTQSAADPEAEQPAAPSWPDSEASPSFQDRSGIYDPSRVVRAPPAYGNTHYSKGTRKTARSNSENARAILIAAALPLTAAAVSLFLFGQDSGQDGGNVGEKRRPGPVAKATLPLSVPTPRKPQPLGSDLNVRLPSGSTSSVAPLKATKTILTLNQYGELETPFSLTLDEDGDLLDSRTREETVAIFNALDLGSISKTSDLSRLSPASGFSPVNPVLITFGTNEFARKLYTLKTSNPDAALLFENLGKSSSARLNQAPVALQSFVPEKFSSQLADGLNELSWLKNAALIYRMSGDKTLGARVEQTLLAWAQVYEPTGDLSLEAPLSSYIFAYSLARSELSNDTTLAVDRFLNRLVSRQAERLRAIKFYDLNHAIFGYNAIAVGLVTNNPILQWLGADQFSRHVAMSPTFTRQGAPTRADLDTYAKLLETMIVLDQVRLLISQPANVLKMSAFLDRVLANQQNSAFATDHKEILADIFKQALYFRPTLLPTYIRAQTVAGVLNNDERLPRFGSVDALLNDTKRRPNSTVFGEVGRTPSAAPTVLPLKTRQK